MPRHCASRKAKLLALALLLGPSPAALAQPVTVTTADDALTIRAPEFTFLKGPPLDRLKDGRSVRVEMALMALPGRGEAPVAAARRIYALSYDLWEERFAAATVESRPRRISHMTSAAVVAWCLEQLQMPLDSMGRLRTDAPFWIRLEYRILDGDDGAGADDEASPFTLQGLIDALSRRRRSESSGDALEAGPFRLPPRDGSESSSLPP